MIEIPERPDRPVCSTHGPLKWGYFDTTKQGPRWVSFTIGDGGVLVPHVCFDHQPVPLRWEPDPIVAARGRRYMDEIRDEMGWGPNRFLAAKGKTLTEEK